MNIQEHSFTLQCHKVPLKKCNARARAMRVHTPNAPKTSKKSHKNSLSLF